MVSNKMFNMLDGRVVANYEVLGALISALIARDPSIANSLIDLLGARSEEYSREVANDISETTNWLKDCLANPPQVD